MVSLLLLNKCVPLRAVSPAQGCPSGAAPTAPLPRALGRQHPCSSRGSAGHGPPPGPADERGRGRHCPPRTPLHAAAAVCSALPAPRPGTGASFQSYGGCPQITCYFAVTGIFCCWNVFSVVGMFVLLLEKLSKPRKREVV